MSRVQEELGRSSAVDVLQLVKSGHLTPSAHDYGNLLDPQDSAKGLRQSDSTTLNENMLLC